MNDVKWIKIVTDIFDDEKVLLIESMPAADSIIVIWFKLLCLAGKNNNSGVFMLNDRIAYTEEMLATIFRRDINTVRLALKTFENYGMIEIINNVITIPNWSKHQTLDQIEERKNYMKDYMKKYREKQKQLASGEEKCKDNSKPNGKVNSKVNNKSNVNSLEGDIDIEEDIEEEVDKDNNSISKDILSSTKVQLIMDKWNSLGLNQLKAISPDTKRHGMLKKRIKDYGIDAVINAIESIKDSDFLMGRAKDFIITFDWFIKPNNFVKVMEGNYLNKEAISNGIRSFRENNESSEKYAKVRVPSKCEELSDEELRLAREQGLI